MKKLIIYALVAFFGFMNSGCSDNLVGYLDTENAEYLPNTMTIRKELDPMVDAIRIQNQAPWVSTKISGVIGTNPLVFSIVDVKSDDVDEAAIEYFFNNVYVQGLGRIYYPINTDTEPGSYTISLGVQNSGDYYHVIEDAMTIIVE
ncbi:hypothetical protein IFO69_09920 [Echinicola sp. CAU 1574]|uniref:DUF4625 domain-containing protein n=1 Tax=Echinicola arenosa TaxID=2774144 RepID=A0ABR9AL30_9BACT|nr:hypothetical protein [Echinicola arenosa]MBD8489062.1 hypothetical protein [Echinicola arenosa]